MTGHRCQWCGEPAESRCRATTGPDTPDVIVYYCRPDTRCWARTYRAVRDLVPRTWEPASGPPPRRPRRPAGPTLFDFLPKDGETA
jgi:hypothetical protein